MKEEEILAKSRAGQKLSQHQLAAMEKCARARGYEADFGEGRFHHEIYLSDVRRCQPEKLKTVIRQPIR